MNKVLKIMEKSSRNVRAFGLNPGGGYGVRASGCHGQTQRDEWFRVGPDYIFYGKAA